MCSLSIHMPLNQVRWVSQKSRSILAIQRATNMIIDEKATRASLINLTLPSKYWPRNSLSTSFKWRHFKLEHICNKYVYSGLFSHREHKVRRARRIHSVLLSSSRAYNREHVLFLLHSAFPSLFPWEHAEERGDQKSSFHDADIFTKVWPWDLYNVLHSKVWKICILKKLQPPFVWKCEEPISDRSSFHFTRGIAFRLSRRPWTILSIGLAKNQEPKRTPS